ncbi:MAG: transposase, partial [Bacteroidota bacterium]
KLIATIQENKQESRKEWMLSIFKSAGDYNSNNTNFQFWRQDNKPIEVYSNAVIDQKLDYLHNNPVEEGIVEQAEDYIYSSARDYAGQKGLLSIEML